jgi:hypothetical protein
MKIDARPKARPSCSPDEQSDVDPSGVVSDGGGQLRLGRYDDRGPREDVAVHVLG